MSKGGHWTEYIQEEVSPYQKKPTKTKSKGRWFWIFILVPVCAMLLLGRESPGSRIVPSELVGTWRTGDPGYGDRYIEIDPVSISFGTGKITFTNWFIEQVESTPAGGNILYTIHYVHNGEKGQCSLYFSGESEKTIYLKNQAGIAWTKDKDILEF